MSEENVERVRRALGVFNDYSEAHARGDRDALDELFRGHQGAAGWRTFANSISTSRSSARDGIVEFADHPDRSPVQIPSSYPD